MASRAAIHKRHFIIPVAWLLVIALLCGLPGNSLPEVTFWLDQLLQFDSAAHTFVFIVFTLLWAVAFRKQQARPLFRNYGEWLAVVWGIAYGVLVEVLQYLVFVRRSAEWADMVADAAGCIIGLALFYIIYLPALKDIKQQSRAA